MDLFLQIAGIVAPVCGIIALGALSKGLKFFDESFVKQGNNALFNVFLPLQLFCQMYGISDLSTIDISPVIYMVAAGVIIAVAGWFYNTLRGRDPETRAVLVQSYIYPNLMIFAVPIAANFYGEASIDHIVLNLLIIFPITNMISLIIYEKTSGKRLHPVGILVNTLKSKLIVFPLVGLFLNYVGLSIPALILSPLKSVGSITAPLGLFLIGAGLRFTSFKGNLDAILDCISIRNFLLPALGLLGASLIGFREQSLFSVALFFCSPIAIASYSYVATYTKKADLSAMLVMLTTVFSMISVTVGLYVIKLLDLI